MALQERLRLGLTEMLPFPGWEAFATARFARAYWPHAWMTAVRLIPSEAFFGDDLLPNDKGAI
jgi:hypothetical protein